jgi:hypothetical protein
VKVASLPVLTETIADQVESGMLATPKAARLLGYVAMRSSVRDRFAVRTARRYRAELRDMGLVLADGFYESVEVDLSAVLEEALESPCWGARG